MRKIVVLCIGYILWLPFISYSQIGEFEGLVRITDGTATLELYDSGDATTKARLRENGSNILLEALRGDLRLRTATNGFAVNRMTIDGATGDIGIGTISPSARLDIRHNSFLNSAHIELDETGANDYARIKMINSGNGKGDFWDIAGRASQIPTVGVSPLNPSELNIYYYDQVYYQKGVNLLRIRPYVNDFAIYRGSFNFRGDLIPEVDNSYYVGVPAKRWNRVYSVNGVSTTSDIRMKKNINEIPYGLVDLMNLNPVRYDWKDEVDTAPQIGLIAQEVLKVIPEVVQATETKVDPITGKFSTVEADVYSMNYDMLIPVLIQSIQDQQVMIDDIRKSNLELKLQNIEFKKLLTSLKK